MLKEAGGYIDEIGSIHTGAKHSIFDNQSPRARGSLCEHGRTEEKAGGGES